MIDIISKIRKSFRPKPYYSDYNYYYNATLSNSLDSNKFYKIYEELTNVEDSKFFGSEIKLKSNLEFNSSINEIISLHGEPKYASEKKTSISLTATLHKKTYLNSRTRVKHYFVNNKLFSYEIHMPYIDSKKCASLTEELFLKYNINHNEDNFPSRIIIKDWYNRALIINAVNGVSFQYFCLDQEFIQLFNRDVDMKNWARQKSKRKQIDKLLMEL